MNILLTGGAGYIGSHTALALLQSGHNVFLYDNFCNSQHGVVSCIEKISGIPILIVEGDVRDTRLLSNTIIENKIEAVIHFAGLKAVADSVINPIDYYENNVSGTVSLLRAMQECSIKKLIFSSSATVYGEPKYLPIDELHPVDATNPYGRTKLHIEQMLQDFAISDPEWRIVSLRYFNPVGAHDSGLIGENPNGTPSNLMPYITQVAIGKLACLNIFGNDYPTLDGTGVRDYIHIMDLADGHLAAISKMELFNGWNVINLGTGRGYSVLEIINTFENVCNQKIMTQFTNRRQGDTATCFANVDKASKQLNWIAKRSLEEMCQSAWNWQLTHSKNI